MRLAAMAHMSMLLPSPSASWLPPSPAVRSACSAQALHAAQSAFLPPYQPSASTRWFASSERSAEHAGSAARGGRRAATNERSSPATTRGHGTGGGEHQYFATCHPGLESVVAAELAAPRIGAQDVRLGKAGVHFRRDSGQKGPSRAGIVMPP